MVADALPGPAAARLAPLVPRLPLGVDRDQVWADLAADPALGPLGRALGRAHRSGAPVVPAVERLADELARSARAEVEERARAVGVKAAVPLGLCLLPSFVLVGVVPLVVSLLQSPGPVTRPSAVHSSATGRLVHCSTGRHQVAARPRVPARRVRDQAAPAATETEETHARTLHHDERGITTAEYAVGTAAGAGLAGLLFKLLTGGFGEQLLAAALRPRALPAGDRVS